jgi:uncharacterized protein (UPF0332 family)
MLDADLKALSKHRLDRAAQTLVTAKRDLDAEDYASANNRAYYCIFYAMRAVLALTGEDYKKHSAVIARFTELYLKTKQLPAELGKIISTASIIRNHSDYQDFYICSIEDTKKLIENAEWMLNTVTTFLQQQYKA